MAPRGAMCVLSAAALIAFVLPRAAEAADARGRAWALWAAREDTAAAEQAVAVWEELAREQPSDGEALLRLSRLHYWLGQKLEESSREKALSHYAKGRRYGKQAAEAAPSKPGGYFFEAANLARENSLKGTLTNLFGIREVRRLNEKAASLDPAYFHGGPDRFFCAYFVRLPRFLGGSARKAVEHGRRAVERSPEYAGNRVFLAEALVADGKVDEARRELRAAIALPDDAPADSVPEQRLEKKRARVLLEKLGE